MLIVCPNCATSYGVEMASLRPAGGRTRRVRCCRCRRVSQVELSYADKLLVAAEAMPGVRRAMLAAAQMAADAARSTLPRLRRPTTILAEELGDCGAFALVRPGSKHHRNINIHKPARELMERNEAKKERELDALAFGVLSSFRHQGALQWTDWYETTRARRGKPGLGTGTFSEIVKRLVAQGRVQLDGDGCYQVVFDTAEDDEGIIINPANSAAGESDHFSEVFREARNGNADIADIAPQQLTETEA
jgi:predicted Zn finger-like uncharacterized protein